MGLPIKFRFAGWALCVLAGIAASGAALAQQAAANPIRIINSALREVEVKAPDGTVAKKLVPAGKVAPGGEVVYRIEVVNSGKAVATGIVVDNPVPAGLMLSDDSASPPTAVSVDGGKTFGQLAALKVHAEGSEPRAAQISDVTNLRWVLAQLAPGSTSKIVFRARVR